MNTHVGRPVSAGLGGRARRATLAVAFLVFAGTLSVTHEARAQDWAVGPYTWQQGQGSTVMKSSATHLCVLTKVQGKYAGGGEWVRVEVGYDGYWRLKGASKQSGVSAEAYCFSFGAFLANGSARWLSEQFVVSDTTGGCGGNSVTTWWGDAATMLSGLSGEFEGGGERTRVTQSIGSFTGSSISAESCRGWLEARGYSFFAGQPHSGQIAKFWGGDYSVDLRYWDQAVDRKEVKMAPVGDAVCYLTKVEGDFGGGGERVRVFQKSVSGVAYWYLEVTAGKLSGGDRRHMTGVSRCYRRDQR